MSRRAHQQARGAEPPRHGGRSLPRRLALPELVVIVAAALVGGYFAARHNGPARATRVTHQSDGGLDLAGTDPVTGRHVDLAAYRGRPVGCTNSVGWGLGWRRRSPVRSE